MFSVCRYEWYIYSANETHFMGLYTHHSSVYFYSYVTWYTDWLGMSQSSRFKWEHQLNTMKLQASLSDVFAIHVANTMTSYDMEPKRVIISQHLVANISWSFKGNAQTFHIVPKVGIQTPITNMAMVQTPITNMVMVVAVEAIMDTVLRIWEAMGHVSSANRISQNITSTLRTF
jgi:hypothetical protein